MIGFALFILGIFLTAIGGIGCSHGGAGCADNPVHYAGILLMLIGIFRALRRIYKGSPKKLHDFDSRYISIEQFSTLSGKSVDGLIKEIQDGNIKGKQFQSGWFISRDELKRLKI